MKNLFAEFGLNGKSRDANNGRGRGGGRRISHAIIRFWLQIITVIIMARRARGSPTHARAAEARVVAVIRSAELLRSSWAPAESKPRRLRSRTSSARRGIKINRANTFAYSSAAAHASRAQMRNAKNNRFPSASHAQHRRSLAADDFQYSLRRRTPEQSARFNISIMKLKTSNAVLFLRSIAANRF